MEAVLYVEYSAFYDFDLLKLLCKVHFDPSLKIEDTKIMAKTSIFTRFSKLNSKFTFSLKIDSKFTYR